MIPGVNILKNAEELYTVKLTANSTEYFVTISARNEKGQKKVIDGKNFIKLHFESSFHTPFMTGQLQLDNSQEKTYLSNISDLKAYDYDMLGSGGEFLNIKIQTTNPSKVNRRITILDENYVIRDTQVGTNGNKKVLNYYFINL